jgi:hypothetical protein
VNYATTANTGIEAQILEAPNDLRIAHRFDPRTFPGQDCRRLAIIWAEAVRQDWLTGGQI